MRDGTFETGRPWLQKIYRLLNASRLLRRLKVGWPIKLSREHYELVCEIVSQAKTEFLKQFPASQFMVLNYPFQEESKDLLACLDRKQVRVLDLSQKEKAELASFEWVIPYNNHPTPAMHEWVARKLLPHLR